jgi:hypothetical protein
MCLNSAIDTAAQTDFFVVTIEKKMSIQRLGILTNSRYIFGFLFGLPVAQ